VDLRSLIFSEYQPEDKEQLIALWQACNLTRPWNDPVKDISFAMQSPSSTILIGKFEEKIIATAMVGHDGHRGAVYYFAVHPIFQKQNYGADMMKQVEAWFKLQGVWKINLLIREDNLAATGFYQALGFEKNEVVSMGKRIT
jgi:ribosomal protein S18 acetylase RimI-like enzyme